MGKLPPQDMDLESAILGALLIQNDTVHIGLEVLEANDFYKEAHQEIFSAIGGLYHAGKPVDILLVTKQLRENGKLEIAGGAGYILELTRRVNSSANLEFHARIVKEYALKRAMITYAANLLREAYEDTSDTFELLDRYETGFLQISGKLTKTKEESFASQLRKTVLDMERVRVSGLIGYRSSYKGINRLLSGYQKKALYLVGARPAMGKSLYMINEAIGLAYKGIAVDIWSLEMSDIQQNKRIISLVTGLDAKRVAEGQLTDEEFDLVRQKERELGQLPINLYDATGVPVSEIRRISRRNRAKGQCEICFVDYLQLITPEQGNGYGSFNRNEAIGAISTSLKEMAKELDIPVIALAQLSRAVETRGGGHIPMLSDLRDSGSLEQDADVIQFLYRPFYYGIMQDTNGLSTLDLLEVHTAKNRGGALDVTPLCYMPQISSISDFYNAPDAIESSVDVGF